MLRAALYTSLGQSLWTGECAYLPYSKVDLCTNDILPRCTVGEFAARAAEGSTGNLYKGFENDSSPLGIMAAPGM
jgi:hypothetical protein